MRITTKLAVLSATAVVVLGGCSTKPKWTRNIQPVRTLDEMYAVQARVNDSAEPYDLGTGDAVGHHSARRARWQTARRK